MSINIDARGLACPEPVIATKKALEGLTDGVVTTIVDNQAAKENVLKFAVASNCGASVEEKAGHYYIKIIKGTADAGPAGRRDPAAPGQAVYLISRNTLGHGSDELGAVLMKSFLYSLLETQPQPRALLFLNSGVLLTAEGSPVLEHLAALAARGVEILSCGTCLEYYQLKQRLAVGAVTNMYNILAELNKPGRAITL